MEDPEMQPGTAVAIQKKLMERYQQQIYIQAKQTVLSYLLTLFCVSIFLILYMLRRKGFESMTLELTLIPLAIDCIQSLALSNIHRRCPLYRHLMARTKDCKITMIDQVMTIVFFIMLCLAWRLKRADYALPYTASCTPLVIMLIQRFIWHQSFLKAFKNPQQVIKYIFQLLLINLVFNFCLKSDEYINFDVIAILWPCYGLIALSFIFFAASLLLFISSACNQFSGQEDETEAAAAVNDNVENSTGALFTCTISTGLLINTGYFLGFSIIGFMALLKEVKEETVFEQGYIGIIVAGFVCIVFIICQLKPITGWYYFKLVRPQVSNELLNYLKQARHHELDLHDLSNNVNNNSSFVSQAALDESNTGSQRQISNNPQQRLQEIEAVNKQMIFRRDLQEINKIELLEDADAEVKSKILGTVPMFLVKVSRSYYQKVENYTKQFMTRVTQYQVHHQVQNGPPGRIESNPNLMNLGASSKHGYLGARAKKKLAQKMQKQNNNKKGGATDSKKIKQLSTGRKKQNNLKQQQQQSILNLINKINEQATPNNNVRGMNGEMASHGVPTESENDEKFSSIPSERVSDKIAKLKLSVPQQLLVEQQGYLDGLEFCDDPVQPVLSFRKEDLSQPVFNSDNKVLPRHQHFSSLKGTPLPGGSSSGSKINHTETQSSEILRMCITSQLQSADISKSIDTTSEAPSSCMNESDQKHKKKNKKGHEHQSSLYPDSEAAAEVRNQKRRNSFDLKQLKVYAQRPKKLEQTKNNLIKLLQDINVEMGLNPTENDSDADLESQDTIKILQNKLKQPLTSAKKTKQADSLELMDEENMVKNPCMLCLERKSDAVIMDCGHSKICFFCAFKMYRTQGLCHLCRNEITKVIKVKRTHGLSYQKVIGILQRYANKFYYSDVNKDLVKELKVINHTNNLKEAIQEGEEQLIALSQQDMAAGGGIGKTEEKKSAELKLMTPESERTEDLMSDIIDECLTSKQIVEIERGHYALVAKSAHRIFEQQEQEQLHQRVVQGQINDKLPQVASLGVKQ